MGLSFLSFIFLVFKINIVIWQFYAGIWCLLLTFALLSSPFLPLSPTQPFSGFVVAYVVCWIGTAHCSLVGSSVVTWLKVMISPVPGSINSELCSWEGRALLSHSSSMPDNWQACPWHLSGAGNPRQLGFCDCNGCLAPESLFHHPLFVFQPSHPFHPSFHCVPRALERTNDIRQNTHLSWNSAPRTATDFFIHHRLFWKMNFLCLKPRVVFIWSYNI